MNHILCPVCGEHTDAEDTCCPDAWENMFSTTAQVTAICNCAKGINSLIRTKLDIFKAYKE